MLRQSSNNKRPRSDDETPLFWDGECPICMEEPEAAGGGCGLLMSCPCGHVFCSVCIRAVLNGCECEAPVGGGRSRCQCRGDCPACRAPTRASDLTAISEGDLAPLVGENSSPGRPEGSSSGSVGAASEASVQERRFRGELHQQHDSARRLPSTKRNQAHLCECGRTRPAFGPRGSVSRSEARWCSRCPGRPAVMTYLGGHQCLCGSKHTEFRASGGGPISSTVVLQVPR